MSSERSTQAKVYYFIAIHKLKKLTRNTSSFLMLVSSISTAIIAAFAITVASDQLYSSNSDAAKEIYKEYITKALENPHYASASFPLWDPRYRHFKYGSAKREGYEYFVTLLLFSADEILDLEEGKHWKNTLKTQFSYHALYLSKAEFNPSSYSCRTRKLVVDSVKQYNKAQWDYSSALSPITFFSEAILCKKKNNTR